MRTFLRQLFVQHPWWFSLMMLLGWLMIAIVLGQAPYVWPAVDSTFLRAAAQIVLALAALGVTSWLGWEQVEPHGGRVQAPLLVVVALVIAVLPIVPGLRIASLGGLLAILLIELVVGFSEELVFRGLILRALLPRGRMLALVASSIMFGAVHLANIIYGSAVGITLLQVLGASVFGFGLACVVLRTKALWPMMFVHALSNTALRFSWLVPDPVPTPLMSALVSTLLLFYGIILFVRTSSRTAIVEQSH